MMKTNKYIIVSAIITVFTIVSSVLIGSVRYSIPQIFLTIKSGFHDPAGYILLYVRIPRTIACFLSGGALAASGFIIQKVMGNKLASPGIIGVNSGAGLAITICFAFHIASGMVISGAAFAGAMVTSLCIITLARSTGMHRSDLILSGLGINGLFNSASEVIRSVNTGAASMSSDFKVGGFSFVTSSRLIPVAIIIIVFLGLAGMFVNDLDVLSLGEDTAKSLGMNTRTARIAFLIMSSALAGAAVSIAGMLSFVGLIVPHIIQRLAGNEGRTVFPLLVLFGGSFVTLCDILARVLFSPYELPTGILISAIGSPFLIYLVLKSKKERVK